MTSEFDFQERSTRKGFYVSKYAAIGAVVVVALLLLIEGAFLDYFNKGLLVGLVGRPTCDDPIVIQPTSNVIVTQPLTTERVTEFPDIATASSAIVTQPPPFQDTTRQSEQSTAAIPDTTSAGGTEFPDVTTPSSDEIWFNPRLPDSLVPISYAVDLRPVLELDQATNTYWFYGTSSVLYQCNVSTVYVMLHSIQLIYDLDELANNFMIMDEETGTSVNIVDAQFYRVNSYLVLTTESPCIEGRNYTLTATSFKGELGDDLNGLYRSEYDNEYGQHRVIALSQMETTGARTTFPCFDEPAFKATFEITLRFRGDQNFTAISNMPPNLKLNQIETFNGSQWNVTTFEVSPIMSTYLLALVVSDFSYEEAFTATGVQTRIYARNVPVSNGEVYYAAQVSPGILDVYAEHFNVPYPLPKSDQMGVPDFGGGAMENWGLVLYREIYLLYDNQTSSVYNKLSVTQVIAHELAHQWFGNLVTAAWWSEIWLNEGFASYVQYIGVNGTHPYWKTDELFIVDDLQSALSVDAYSDSHPLYHPQGYFSTVTYSKGASFLRMVDDFLGTTTFTNALTNYLNDNAYDVATHDILFQFWIDEAASDGLTFPYPLQDIFETWVLQMGYPLLTVTRTTPDTITITQEYFLIDPNDVAVDTPGSEVYKYKWYVPFTYKTSSQISIDDHKLEWMGLTDPLELTTSDDYILANINAVGFYRVQYEPTMLDMIITKLMSSSFSDISPQNRAQLLDDAFAISRSGRLDVETVLDMTNYLHQDLEYITWDTFLSSITYYERMLGRSPIYGDFSQYVLDLVVPSIYNNYGWDDSDTSDTLQIERMTRGLAVGAACEYNYPECIGNATEKFKEWMMDPSVNNISPTYRSNVYCSAIRAGGVEEWDFAWQQYLAVDSAHEKTNLRYALSCSKDPWILNRYIQYALDVNNVRRQDSSSTLSYIGGQEYGKYVAWSFAENNWDLLMSTVGSSATNSMLSAATGRFSTDFDWNVIETLRPIAGSGWTGTLNSYQDSVDVNIAWRNDNEQRIADWLGSGVQIPVSTKIITHKRHPKESRSNFKLDYTAGFNKIF